MKRELSSSSSSSGFLPFLEEAVEKRIAIVGGVYEIIQVSESRKRNGWVCKSKEFQIFLWKSDDLADTLLQTLESFVAINPAHGIFVEINDNTVAGYSMYVDEEQSRLWAFSKKLRILMDFKCSPTHAIPETRQTLSRKK